MQSPAVGTDPQPNPSLAKRARGRPRKASSKAAKIQSPYRLIRLKKLLSLVKASRSTVYAWMDRRSTYHDPSFPRPIRYTAKSTSVAWVLSDVEAWLEKSAAIQREEPSPNPTPQPTSTPQS